MLLLLLRLLWLLLLLLRRGCALSPFLRVVSAETRVEWQPTELFGVHGKCEERAAAVTSGLSRRGRHLLRVRRGGL